MFIATPHQIRSLADKGTSWHITSSLWRKLTRAGDLKWQCAGRGDEEVKFLTEQKIRANREKGKKGKHQWGEKKYWQRERWHLCISVSNLQIWGGVGAGRLETWRWRVRKNSKTGLASTLTFIIQEGGTHSLSLICSLLPLQVYLTLKFTSPLINAPLLKQKPYNNYLGKWQEKDKKKLHLVSF